MSSNQRHRLPPLPALALAAILLGLAACGRGTGSDQSGPGRAEPLRVLVRADPIAFLPRNADPVELDREIAEGLAESLGRPLEFVLIEDSSRMIEELLSGRADLIAASLTATDERRQLVDFSLPYLTVDELLIVVAEGSVPAREEDLSGLEITVRESSSYAETLRNLETRVPGLRIRWADEEDGVEDILDRVAAGETEATLVDSHIWAAVSAHYPTLRAGMTLAEDRPICIAMRPGEVELRSRVNEYLIARALTSRREEVYRDDLPGLRERRRLRMITRNGAATYYLHRGEQLGFEYELLERFCERHDLRLEIVIPPARADLETWLLEGRGDVIAASLAIPAGGDSVDGGERPAFTIPVATVEQMVVVREDVAEGLRGPEDLAGRRVHVRRSGPHLAPLRELLDRTGDFEIAFFPEELETDEVLALIESGVYDVTVCEENLLQSARHTGRKVAPAFALARTEIGWETRPEDRELRFALDRFLEEEHKSLFYNLTWARYFEGPPPSSGPEEHWRSDVTGNISTWDPLAKRWAAAYDLDWRLLLSQMYQESRFDPTRVSFAGASGLMQLTPRTAREMGIADAFDPAGSIEGGARYMRWLLDRTDPGLPLATRIRFALAGYNAGRGHLQDARHLAARLGLNPDRWVGNVERAMLLLEKHEHYSQSRFGYCRGSECVRYVREIDERYRTWVRQLPAGRRSPQRAPDEADRPD